MRYVNIFLLFFQRVLHFRSRSFVWFLNSFLNPLIILLFWVALYKEKGEVLGGWPLSELASYYLLIVIASSFIIAHVEEDVAVHDIREGDLVRYLTRPISYYWMKFFGEIPWRIVQGFFGVVVFSVFYTIFNKFISIPNSIEGALSTLFVIILAVFISFTLKMIVGLSAFWFTDFWGLQQVVEVIIVVLAGFVMPIMLLPDWIRTLSLYSPFPYMIYFPVRAFQSSLTSAEIIHTITVQLIWVVLLYIVYKLMWVKGVKKFTGVSQ